MTFCNQTKHIVFDVQYSTIKNNLTNKHHTESCEVKQNSSCRRADVVRVDDFKYLGLYIDSRLKWIFRINCIMSVIRIYFFVLRNSRDTYDKSYLRILYI